MDYEGDAGIVHSLRVATVYLAGEEDCHPRHFVGPHTPHILLLKNTQYVLLTSCRSLNKFQENRGLLIAHISHKTSGFSVGFYRFSQYFFNEYIIILFF